MTTPPPLTRVNAEDIVYNMHTQSISAVFNSHIGYQLESGLIYGPYPANRFAISPRIFGNSLLQIPIVDVMEKLIADSSSFRISNFLNNLLLRTWRRIKALGMCWAKKTLLLPKIFLCPVDAAAPTVVSTYQPLAADSLQHYYKA